MLGDITIDKFTKSTFMNLVDFCEKLNATQMILVQNRDHVQKGMIELMSYILISFRGIQKVNHRVRWSPCWKNRYDRNAYKGET